MTVYRTPCSCWYLKQSYSLILHKYTWQSI